MSQRLDRKTRVSGSVALMAGAGLLLSGMSAAGAAADEDGPDRLARVLGTDSQTAVAGRYIVVLDRGAGTEDATEVRGIATYRGARIQHDYRHALRGFSAWLPAKAVEALRHSPHVAWIEADTEISIAETQTPATWGIDRIDQRSLPLDNRYTTTSDGAGVSAYIVDTGVRASHTDFGGRVVPGFSSVNDGRGSDDCHGHGTHVAGSVGSTTYGVADKVTIVPVRVLNCFGSTTASNLLAGMDWMVADHDPGEPAVGNMSLGGLANTTIDTAVKKAVADGITMVVAAGNSDANACNTSPARLPEAVTVGASTIDDQRADFSNHGSCLDIFAPGKDITAPWKDSDTATKTVSGTSMASPHVAGAAAAYLATHPSASPQAVRDALVGAATSDALTGVGTGSPNKLLNVGFGAAPTPTPTPTPTPPPAGGNLVANPGFESGAVAWTAPAGVITSDAARPAHAGSWKAWLGGNGATSTETLSQQVTVPVGSRATLTYWLRIDSAEWWGWWASDTLQVTVDGQQVGQHSDLGTRGSWAQHTVDLSSYAGKTVTLGFTASEDWSAQTSFVLDDVAVTLG